MRVERITPPWLPSSGLCDRQHSERYVAGRFRPRQGIHDVRGNCYDDFQRSTARESSMIPTC